MKEADLGEALDSLIEFAQAYRSELIAMARGRYAEGVFRFPDGPLFRKSAADLDADKAQELADAIVYEARRQEIL